VSAWFTDLQQDLRYAVRALARSRAFTLIGVVSLALGIGVNVGYFAYFDAVMWKPVPGVNGVDRLVEILSVDQGRQR